MENDSPNGTQVTTVRSWELGSHVELTRPNGEKWARARVVYCKPLDEKRFAVGLNLLKLADDSSPRSEPPKKKGSLNFGMNAARSYQRSSELLVPHLTSSPSELNRNPCLCWFARRGVTILLEVISSFLATASKIVGGRYRTRRQANSRSRYSGGSSPCKESLVFSAEAATYGNCFNAVCCKERGMGPNRKEEEGFLAA